MRAGLAVALVLSGTMAATTMAGQQPLSRTKVADGAETISTQLAAFNAHDVEALAANVAVDFAWYAVDSDDMRLELRGREDFAASMQRYFAAFPDARAEISAPVGSGSFLSVLETSFWSDQSGQQQSTSSLAVYEIRDGLIHRVWYYPVR